MSAPQTQPDDASRPKAPASTGSAWERFVSARSSDAFCSAWLALIAEKFQAVKRSAVLVEANDGQTYAPLAIWPEAVSDMAAMGAAVQQALAERKVIVAPAPEQPECLHVAAPVSVQERIVGAVVLEVRAERIAIGSLLRELHWGSAWLDNLFGRRELNEAQASRARAMGILEALAVALRHKHLQQALFELTNELRRRFDCSRVAIGIVRSSRVKLAALSEAATFEKSSPMVRAYVDAMGETCDLAQVIECGAGQDPDETHESYRAHALLQKRVDADALLSLPVNDHAQTTAVITLERGHGGGFNTEERQWLETFATLFAPVLAQRQEAERISLKRFGDELARFWRALLGPRHLLWKLGGGLVAVALALLIWLPVSYRVSARTVIEGSVQRVAAAPFQGYLAAAYVRAGDTVKKGQTLARLDDHDLLVERAKWSSQRDQYANKLRQAMAEHDLTAVRVVTAQLHEAQAQLDLAREKLSRVNVVAPYDGVVVTGDISQQIGMPVEAGKKLFEIAPLHAYRVILKVDERDIGVVHVGERGELLMNGLTNHPLHFAVARVMPVATAKDGKNVYRVEAKLDDSTRELLPGMEGVGKIDIGRRKLGWVLLHSLFNWFRLTLWKWSP